MAGTLHQTDLRNSETPEEREEYVMTIEIR